MSFVDNAMKQRVNNRWQLNIIIACIFNIFQALKYLFKYFFKAFVNDISFQSFLKKLYYFELYI